MDNNFVLDANNDCYEFTLLEDCIILIYENNTWFVEIDSDEIEDDIIIIESKELDIDFSSKEEINLWDRYIFKKEEFEEIKAIVASYGKEEDIG